MRKLLLWTAAALIALPLSGCHEMVPQQAVPEQTIYASFAPVYALAAPIVEDVPGISLRCLVQPQDGCLRNYELSDWDEALLGNADAAILAGRGLESFESRFSGGGLAVISAQDGLALINNGVVAAEGDEPDHFDGENPWGYLSVELARAMSASIASGMAQLDPDFYEAYEHNLAHFDEALEALLTRMEEAIIAAPEASVAVMHEGLFYMADELGLDVAAVVRREPGTALSDNELDAALATLSGSGAEVILIERQAPQSLRRALESAGYQLALIDTLATHTPGESGGYIQTMDSNAQALAAALKRAAG
jgi:ABC-type Zn uptake system ZnuABC Zn-binding protein ZnuA